MDSISWKSLEGFDTDLSECVNGRKRQHSKRSSLPVLLAANRLKSKLRRCSKVPSILKEGKVNNARWLESAYRQFSDLAGSV